MAMEGSDLPEDDVNGSIEDELPGEGAGEQAGDTDAGTGGAAAGAAAGTPPTRTFTQDQVNAFIAQERRRWEAANARRVAPPARPSGTETPAFDAQTRAALDAYLANQLQPVREFQVNSEIERAQNNAKAAYPELADQANMDAVIETILSWGEDIVNRAPMDWLMEQGYRTWKFKDFNDEKYRQQVLADYQQGKADKARRVPTAQGSGGKATTSPKKDDKTWKGADAAMKQLIEEENSARA